MNKKSWLGTKLKNSFIIGWLITFADFLYSQMKQSSIVHFFSDYDAFEKNYNNSFIGRFLSRFKVSRSKIVELKKNFSGSIEESLFSGIYSRIKKTLLTAKLRVYGAFLFSYGFASSAVFALHIFVFSYQISPVSLFISGICILVGIVWAFSKKPLGQAVYDSLFIGFVLRNFVGLRREDAVYDNSNDHGVTLGLFLGLILGLACIKLMPYMLFGAIFAVICLILIAARPEFGVMVIVLTAPFLPTMVMCALTILCVVTFIIKVARGKRTLHFEAVDLAVLIFMIFIFFGGAVSVDTSTSIKSAAVFLALMMNYFLIANLIRGTHMIKQLLYCFSFSVFITALIGLYQKFFMAANTTWHDTSMFDDIGTRIYSTFQNPNVYGEYLVMTIPLIISLIITVKSAKQRLANLIVTASALAALIYTQSRGSWLAFLISISIYLLVINRRILVVYLLGIFSLPVLPFVLPSSIVSRFMSIGNLGDSSTSYRVSIWQASTEMIKDFFTDGIGIGTGAFSRIYPYYSFAGIEAAPHSHQLFFQIAIEMGIFALIAFIMIIFILIRKNSQSIINYQIKNDYNIISTAALCSILGMLVQGMTDYVWYNYRVFGVFWIVMGLCVASLRCAKDQQTNQERNVV